AACARLPASMYGSIRTDDDPAYPGRPRLTETATNPESTTTLPKGATVDLTTHTDDNKTVVRVCLRSNDAIEIVASIPVEEAEPDLGLPEGSVTRIVALDVLEHVLDEEAWLAAMSSSLASGGTLVVRTPLE